MLGQTEELAAALRTWSPAFCWERLHVRWVQGCDAGLEIQGYGGKSLENKAMYPICCVWQARNGPKGKKAVTRNGENKVGQTGSMTLEFV